MTTMTLYCDRDANGGVLAGSNGIVTGGYAVQNGTATTIRVGGRIPDSEIHGFFHYPVSSLPALATITAVTGNWYIVSNAGWATTEAMRGYAINETWTEADNSATLDGFDQGAADGTGDSGGARYQLLFPPNRTAATWLTHPSASLLNMVQDWYSGALANYGLKIVPGAALMAGGDNILFGAREGSFPSYLTVTYTAPPTTPGAITEPDIGATYDASITAAWGASTSPDAITYELQYSANNGGAWNALTTTAATSYVWDTSALTAGTAYLFRVRATSTAGNSAFQTLGGNFTIQHPPVNVGVYVGSFTKQAGVGNQDITLPTGCPNLTAAAAGTWAIMFWSTSAFTPTATGVWGGQPWSTLGFTTGPSNSYAVGFSSQDGAGTSDAARRLTSKCITFQNPDSFATNIAEADFVSFPTATTMRINWTTMAYASAWPIMFTIFTGLTNAKVVKWTEPATAIAKAVTGVGFRPDLVFNATICHPGPAPITGGSSYFGFGAFNKHGQQWANSVASEDGVTPSNTSRYQQTDACLASTDVGQFVLAQAHFKSMDADGFTLNFSSAIAAYEVISLCLGGVSSKIGGEATAAPIAVVNSKHGFTLRGALFSGIMATLNSAPSLYALWSLGATDLTNYRAVALWDTDGVNPTVAKSVWINNGALVVDATGASSIISQITNVTEAPDHQSFARTQVSNGCETLHCLIGDAGTDTFPQLQAT